MLPLMLLLMLAWMPPVRCAIPVFGAWLALCGQAVAARRGQGQQGRGGAGGQVAEPARAG